MKAPVSPLKRCLGGTRSVVPKTAARAVELEPPAAVLSPPSSCASSAGSALSFCLDIAMFCTSSAKARGVANSAAALRIISSSSSLPMKGHNSRMNLYVSGSNAIEAASMV